MTTAPRRQRTRVLSRAESSVEFDDEQLVEVAELGARPRARVAFHDLAGEHFTVARATIAELGHELVAAGAGKTGLGRVVEALRADRPPEVAGVPISMARDAGCAVLEAWRRGAALVVA